MLKDSLKKLEPILMRQELKKLLRLFMEKIYQMLLQKA